MFIMNLPKPYGGNVVLSATYLINWMPLKALDYKSPLEVLQSKTSYTVPPKVFYCVCFVHAKNIRKLESRALKFVFVGYPPTQKGYKCYYPPFRKYCVSIDVTFKEFKSYFPFNLSPLQEENEK